MTEPIRASGGLVFRRSSDGDVEVLCVHRPRYDDWSLPKGKDDPGETPEQAAVREIFEETGVPVRVLAHLDDIEYTVSGGRTKIVRYFAMRPLDGGAFAPNSEVDEIRWVPRDACVDLLSYDHDRDLVANSDYELLARTGTLWLVRHAAAGSRSAWRDDDRLRPVNKKGARQASALAEILAPAGVERILSSPYLRCVQTVEPLSAALGIEIEEVPLLGEGGDGSALLDWVDSLAGENAVLCSHGDMIPDILERLAARGTELRSPTGVFDCKKGSVWTVAVDRGRYDSATYLPPPAA